MNVATSGALSAREVADLVADARSLVGDADLGVSLTHYARGQRGYDPARGTVGHVETATVATGFLAPLTEREARDIPGAELGDVRCLVSSATVASASPGDRVEVGSDHYTVVRADSGPVDAYLSLTLRRMVS